MSTELLLSSMNVWTEGFRQELQPSGMERGALNFDRRDFLKGLGAGLLVRWLRARRWAQESGRGGGWGGHALPKDLNAWIHIGADGAGEGVYRQSRSGAEHPHLAGAGGGGRAADAVRLHHDDHGRHRPGAVGHGHVRKPDHADHGSAAAQHGGGGAADADRDGGAAVAGGCVAAHGRGRQGDGGERRPVDCLRRTDARRKAGEGGRGRSAAHAGDGVEDCGDADPQGGRARFCHRQAQVSIGHCAAGDDVWRGGAARRDSMPSW